MMALGQGEQPGAMLDAAALGIEGPEIEAADAGEADRRRAHGAGFEGDVQIGADKTRRSPKPCRLADRQQFCMGRGIVQALRPVVGTGQHAAARAIDNDGPDRHLARFGSPPCLGESKIHR